MFLFGFFWQFYGDESGILYVFHVPAFDALNSF